MRSRRNGQYATRRMLTLRLMRFASAARVALAALRTRGSRSWVLRLENSSGSHHTVASRRSGETSTANMVTCGRAPNGNFG